MRFLKALTIGMGVLILLGTTLLVIMIMRRVDRPVPTIAAIDAVLEEPAGTRIVTVTAVADRLAVQLQGGGADRIVLIDPRTGATVGRIGLGAKER